MAVVNYIISDWRSKIVAVVLKALSCFTGPVVPMLTATLFTVTRIVTVRGVDANPSAAGAGLRYSAALYLLQHREVA